jgi:hypothetical protein
MKTDLNEMPEELTHLVASLNRLIRGAYQSQVRMRNSSTQPPPGGATSINPSENRGADTTVTARLITAGG